MCFEVGPDSGCNRTQRMGIHGYIRSDPRQWREVLKPGQLGSCEENLSSLAGCCWWRFVWTDTFKPVKVLLAFPRRKSGLALEACGSKPDAFLHVCGNPSQPNWLQRQHQTPATLLNCNHVVAEQGLQGRGSAPVRNELQAYPNQNVVPVVEE
ncbi:hypothetical protein D3C85_1196300 [compost metagenome]